MSDKKNLFILQKVKYGSKIRKIKMIRKLAWYYEYLYDIKVSQYQVYQAFFHSKNHEYYNVNYL